VALGKAGHNEVARPGFLLKKFFAKCLHSAMIFFKKKQFLCRVPARVALGKEFFGTRQRFF